MKRTLTITVVRARRLIRWTPASPAREPPPDDSSTEPETTPADPDADDLPTRNTQPRRRLT